MIRFIFLAIGLSGFTLVHSQQLLKVGDYLPPACIEKIEKALLKQDESTYTETPLLILNFCAPACKDCVAFSKHIGLLKMEFLNRLQVINITDRDSIDLLQARNFYKSIVHYEIPYITNDSLFHSLFTYKLTPHLVWINRQKQIIAITPKEYATTGNISIALDGHHLPWRVKFEIPDYDFSIPIVSLTEKNASSYPVLMTALTGNIIGVGRKKIQEEINNDTRRLRLYNFGIIALYKNAISAIYPDLLSDKRIIFELKNQHRFYYDSLQGYLNDWEAKNYYCYQSELPLAFSEPEQYKIMLADLNRYFKMDGRVEKRMTNIWVINKINTGRKGIEYNAGIEKISLKLIVSMINNHRGKPYLVNETGLPDNTQLALPPLGSSSFKMLKKAFRKNGIRLQQKKRNFELFVLTEK